MAGLAVGHVARNKELSGVAPFPLHMDYPGSPQERVVLPLAIEPPDSDN
jgi:hypothetical protein